MIRERRIPWDDADDTVWIVRFYRSKIAPEHVVEWRVWEVFDMDRDDPNKIAEDDKRYEFEGSTKWDGCTNWSTRGATHACDREKLAAIGVLLARIYDEASDIFGQQGANFLLPGAQPLTDAP